MKRRKLFLVATAVAALVLLTLFLSTHSPTAPFDPMTNDCNKPHKQCTITTLHSPPLNTTTTTKILYYTTHRGTTANLLSLLPHLPQHLHLSHFNPAQISGYAMSHARARALVEMGHAGYICSGFDVIVIGDTVPHGRAILLSLLELRGDGKRCGAGKVVVEMTNRFDWDVEEETDRDEFYALMRRLVETSREGGELEGEVVWVANNLAEKRWLERRVGVDGVDVKLLRPMGGSDGRVAYPSDLPAPNPTKIITQRHKTLLHSHLLHTLNLSLTIIPFSHPYGGPHHLAKFKAFLDIPYQYSTMKLYENIAYGVPLLVPTPRFLLEMGYSGLHPIPLFSPQVLGVLDDGVLKERYHTGWARYVDYYDPEFAPFITYFDSYDELKGWVDKSREEVGRDVRVAGPLFYEGVRRRVVEGWREVLF
ncbi:hypothetical protein HDU98_011953 [Podochytrium sp. JEL0797]|nr:hypothetical protein HDU98_011953 [Podochytrium sp. JEL0797]